MNASKFMDKQIMDLSRSKSDLLNTKTNEFLDLMNPQSDPEDDNHGVAAKSSPSPSLINKKDQILASYDFHPIPRPAGGVGVSSSLSSVDAPAAATATSPRRAWNSLDSKPNSTTLRSYQPVDPVEPEKVVTEKAHKINDSPMVPEIDRMMKKYTDSLLHAIDGLSARLSQLESRTSRLEYAVDDLKVCIGNNHGSTDGKMRQLENILLEVQSGMQDVKDKQEVMEGHMLLAKLQMSKVEKPSETPNAANQGPAPQQAVSAPPQQSQLQQLPMPPVQPVPSVPANVPAPQQNMQTVPPMAAQYPPAQAPPVPQRDSYFPPSGQTQEAPSHQYQMPPPSPPQQQAPIPTPPPQPQQYQPAPTPPYSQPPPPPQQQHPPVAPANAPPQYQPPISHHPEENPYIPPQSYPANPRQAASQPSSGAPPHSQSYYGGLSSMYDAPPPPAAAGRSVSGFSSGYAPTSGPSEPYSYSSPPSHYGSSSSFKPQQQPHSPGVSSSNYPKLPTAKILPQAIPTATGISDGPSSGGGGNRVPIDDVVDKVTSMGFPREHVRATVRRLTENGQSVDLNVVLDKLMNDGDVQPPRGWFGR